MRGGTDGEGWSGPIPAGLRQRFEDALAVDLSGIRLRAVDGLTSRRTGARVVAEIDRDEISLNGWGLSFDDSACRHVLAHELVHWMQHRLSREFPLGQHLDDEEAEQQANAGALEIVAGRPLTCVGPARQAPRNFDVQGHYYTVYLVALMAGATPEKANELAFYAQLPDQLSELDAISVFDWCIIQARRADAMLRNTSERKRRLVAEYGGIVGTTMLDIGDYFTTIQQGIHCLNGNLAERETKYRIERLSHLDPIKNPVLFGIALHSLGDSYAHRCLARPDYMYPCVIGHAVDWDLFEINWTRMRATYLGGHAADNINVRRTLYLEYGVEMWTALRSKFKTRPSLLPDGVAPYSWVRSVLSIPSATRDGVQQTKLLKGLISAACGTPPPRGTGADYDVTYALFEKGAKAGNAHKIGGYVPGGETCAYGAFRGRRDLGEYPFSPSDFGWAVDLAEGWKRAKR